MKCLYLCIFMFLFSCEKKLKVDSDELPNSINIQLQKEDAFVVNELHNINIAYVFGENNSKPYSSHLKEEEQDFKIIYTNELIDILRQNNQYFNSFGLDMTQLKHSNYDYLENVDSKFKVDSAHFYNPKKKIYYFTKSINDINNNFIIANFKTNQNKYGYLLYFLKTENTVIHKYNY